MIDKFKLIYGLMDARDKRKLVLIAFISVVNGLLSVVGIASILPFIGLISEPELLESNKYIQLFSEITGITSYRGVVVAFGGISLLLVVLGNMLSAFDVWIAEVFGYKKQRELSERLLRTYLRTDVLEFERKKSSERAKEILSEVDRVIMDTLFSMFDMVSGTIVCGFIVLLLLIVNWSVTLTVAAALMGAYLVIHKISGRHLDSLGKEFSELESLLYNDVLEALKLHKEIKLAGVSGFFVSRYARSCSRMLKNRLKHSVISILPQYSIEVTAYGIILLLAIYFALFSTSGTAPITMIGMYAFAAYRLMPSVADVFHSVQSILFDSAILAKFVEHFNEPVEVENNFRADTPVRESIALSGVSFRYSPNSAFHLENLDVEFAVNSMTCLKGKTGCGKSTILNLVAGLYHPDEGVVKIDGETTDVYGSREWKRRIGYVPASVNVLQSSMAENIAIGVPFEEIDRERVREVAEMVDLDAHIMSLRKGYDSVYGDDGLCFSSGQIQKVGLARALYRNPSILLLDESTDAFDIKTEALVLERLTSLEDVTIIFISHRPSVHEFASRIIDLEEVLTKQSHEELATC